VKITDGHGVDVIYDPVGMIAGQSALQPAYYLAHIVAWTDCLKCIAWKGRAIVVGFAAGKIEKARSLIPNNK
jgi:NADPH2:quinone reductase